MVSTIYFLIMFFILCLIGFLPFFGQTKKNLMWFVLTVIFISSLLVYLGVEFFPTAYLITFMSAIISVFISIKMIVDFLILDRLIGVGIAIIFAGFFAWYLLLLQYRDINLYSKMSIKIDYKYKFNAKANNRYALISSSLIFNMELLEILLDNGAGHIIIWGLLMCAGFSLVNKLINLLSNIEKKDPKQEEFIFYVIAKDENFEYSYKISSGYFKGGFGSRYSSFKSYINYSFTVSNKISAEKSTLNEDLAKGILPLVLSFRSKTGYTKFKKAFNGGVATKYDEKSYPHILFPEGANVSVITSTKDNTCRWVITPLNINEPVTPFENRKDIVFSKKGIFVEKFSYVSKSGLVVESPVVAEVISKKEFETRVAKAALGKVKLIKRITSFIWKSFLFSTVTTVGFIIFLYSSGGNVTWIERVITEGLVEFILWILGF